MLNNVHHSLNTSYCKKILQEHSFLYTIPLLYRLSCSCLLFGKRISFFTLIRIRFCQYLYSPLFCLDFVRKIQPQHGQRCSFVSMKMSQKVQRFCPCRYLSFSCKYAIRCTLQIPLHFVGIISHILSMENFSYLFSIFRGVFCHDP